nr:alpha/beta fold hydrolase [Opitutaceae bacterium]
DSSPVALDPVFDPKYPPSMHAFKIPSAGVDLNALLYRASGAERRPVVVVFHGYPGNEKNLDLAQAIRRAGLHVLWFNYRGSWGTGGEFSFANALEDARNVLAFVRSPEAAERFGFDASRIAVVGHSFGGWLAFNVGAEDQNVRAVAGLASWNAVVSVRATGGDPEKKAALIAALDEFGPVSGPLRGAGSARIYDEVLENAVAYDFFRKAERLKTRPLLVIAGSRDVDQPLDAYHDPLVVALQDAQAPRVEVQVYDDDHSFSASRLALADRVTRWLVREIGQP